MGILHDVARLAPRAASLIAWRRMNRRHRGMKRSAARAKLQVGAAAVLLLAPLSSSAQTPAAVRGDLDAVSSALDRALRAAGSPGARGMLIGGASTRAYVLPGVGAVFVAPPRALPSGRARRDRTRRCWFSGPTAKP